MKGQFIFSNFLVGEMSPRFEGRIELPQYRNSCRTLENWIINDQGNADRRPGTVYVNTTKTASKSVRLQDFVIADDQRWILEFGHNYIRFYKAHVPAGGVGSEYEVVTTYTEAELPEIKFAAGPDKKLYIVHPSHAPATLTRTTDTNWTLADITFETVGVYEDFNAADDYPSCITFFENRAIYAATNNKPFTLWGSVVGDYDNIANESGFEFTASSKSYERIRWIQAKSDILIGTSSSEYILTAYGAPIEYNNASTVRQSRHGSHDVDSELIGSEVLFLQKGGRRIRQYQFVRDVESFKAFDITFLNEHITEGGITQLAAVFEPQAILFGVRGDGELIALAYNPETGLFAWSHIITEGTIESVAVIPTDTEDEIWISVLRTDSDEKRYLEYFKPRDWGSDNTDIWYVDSGVQWDGGDAEDIEGISKADPAVVTITGHSFSNDDLVKIESVGGMTEINTLHDGIYTVKNKAADTFQLYDPEGTTAIDSSGFTTYTSGGTAKKVIKTVTGLDHLDNQSVQVFADGATLAGETVSGGSTTIDEYANKVQVGLGYVSDLIPMRIDLSSTSAKKRISKLALRVYKTLSCQIGQNEDHLDEIIHFDVTMAVDTSLAPFTGDLVKPFPGGYTSTGDILIRVNEPVPCTILALIPTVEENATI